MSNMLTVSSAILMRQYGPPTYKALTEISANTNNWQEKNVHLNCHGNASQFQFAVSIPTARLSHATTESAESLITLNEQAVMPVIQYVLQTS
jgi:hypothetical protein